MRTSVLAIFLITLLLQSSLAFSQDRKISGTVTDANGAGVEGVSVANQSTKASVLTDASGTFSINGAPGQRLLFTHISFAQKEMIIGSESTLTVALEQLQNVLSDV